MTDNLSGPVSCDSGPDGGGTPSYNRLMPYVTIGGTNEFGSMSAQFLTPAQFTDLSVMQPVKRLAIVIAPVLNTQGGTPLNYPNEGRDKWMMQLDSADLYTNPIGTFGKQWSDPSPDSEAACFEKYGINDGAYSSSAPVQGLPITFKKIYFRGQETNFDGKITGSGCNSYYAYFPCSDPVHQNCYSGGTGYNPRNENYGMMDGVVTDWSGFDIGCGGGGGGQVCESGLQVTGINSDNSGQFEYSGTPWSGNQCDNFFAVSGCGVEIQYINATGGPFEGKRGPLIEFEQKELFVGEYEYSVEDQYQKGSYASTGCSCDDLVLFTGNVIVTPIKATGEEVFNGRASGACGYLVTVGDGGGGLACDKNQILNCLGYFETGMRLVFASGQYDETGMCDVNLLVNCNTSGYNSWPPESQNGSPGRATGCPCADPPSGACCGEHMGGWGCEFIERPACNGQYDYYWGDNVGCDDAIYELEDYDGGTFMISDYDPFGESSYTPTELCVTGSACWQYDDGSMDGDWSYCTEDPLGGTAFNGGKYTFANYLRDYKKYVVDLGSYMDGQWNEGIDCDDDPCPT